MTAVVDRFLEPHFFFTAPWEPVVVRRGDALGLRALADEFAEAVAPGLSNRVNDGRWVTILAWCLVRSHEVFFADHGRSVATAAEQRKRYAWLRPLELMWVARTIALAGEDASNRSMSGQRSVRRWYKEKQQSTDRFGMSEVQFRAYRQTGMYGGYRVAFRGWPGLTLHGDGWTPGPEAFELAKWLNKQLGKDVLPKGRVNRGDDNKDRQRSRGPTLGKGDRHDWWLRHWDKFDHEGRNADANTLPRRKDDFAKLPEAGLLEPIIFGDRENDNGGQRRCDIAREIEKSSVKTHLEICEHLAKKFSDNGVIAHLARFSRLADAGIEAMELIAKSLAKDSSSSLKEVAESPDAAQVCVELHAAALAWLNGAECEPSPAGVTHLEKATIFAHAITSADPQECLKALLHHHKQHGGGLLWFVLRDGQIETRSIPNNRTAARYRFRLWPLCRLASQCGVIRQMPRAFQNDTEESDDDEQ